jgi:RHS repeat-associated protein
MAGPAGVTVSYGYDGHTTPHHTNVYVYDTARRLVDVYRDGALAAHYDHDANGNRLSRTTPSGAVTGSYDDQDRLLSYGGITYAYQDSGELLSRMDTATSETTLFSYDALGSLRQVVLPGGTTIDYVVDGLGRRVGKKVGGVLMKGWLYGDALRPIAELDGAGTVVARFVYAAGGHTPALMIQGSATYRIVADAIGSVRLVVDAATGAVAQRIDYDEFGRVLLDTSPGFQPFGFAGGLYDPDTKLVRFGARDYNPETGRWTAKDPILFEGGDTNLYGYVLGDPINLTDVRGTGPVELFMCLLDPSMSALDCLSEEADRFRHGPAGDCENCDETGAVGNPFRTPAQRFPSFARCEGLLVQASVRCCKDICGDDDDDDMNVCPGNVNVEGTWSRECYNACMDQVYKMD